MGPGRETGRRDPDTKPSKDTDEIPAAPPLLSDRPCHTLTSFLKSALTFCLILSISLVVYSAFTRPIPSPSSTRWWLSSSSTSTVTLDNKLQSAESPGATALSHIVFGLAGSAATWHQRRHYSELWWAPNSTRGFVWLDELPAENYTWPATSPPYKVSPFDPTRDHRASDRIARILKGSFEGGGAEEARWFVMGDDDTVFFKENLVAVLSRYDHRRMWYVGGISESVEQNVMHSYRTAFGGGGFAISYALARHLANMMDGCVQRYTSFYGSDEKISACVGELGVPLTRELGFHQLDIRDDPYGLLAAHPVSPLVSLHHLDYIKPLFPHKSQLDSLKILQQAYKLDPARTMQQSICYSHTHKWSVSVSWGYTVQLYPSLISSRELELPLQTFRTWRSWNAGPFVFNTRPVKPDPCQQPVVYFLDRVVETRGGNKTLATYKRRDVAPAEGKVCEQAAYKYARSVEKITVAASKMHPQELLKAPRRQCCEIRNGWSLKRSMQIVLRTCKFGETITA